MNNLFDTLKLSAQNSGASSGSHFWSAYKSEGEIVSINPATGQAIASVYRASSKD